MSAPTPLPTLHEMKLDLVRVMEESDPENYWDTYTPNYKEWSLEKDGLPLVLLRESDEKGKLEMFVEKKVLQPWIVGGGHTQSGNPSITVRVPQVGCKDTVTGPCIEIKLREEAPGVPEEFEDNEWGFAYIAMKPKHFAGCRDAVVLLMHLVKVTYLLQSMPSA